ncbi:hypothetical protein ABZ907_45445 [Nonomuraea wenchangensis]
MAGFPDISAGPENSRIGRVDRDGVFRALSAGETTATAQHGKAAGDIDLTGLRRLARLETETRRINPARVQFPSPAPSMWGP